MKPFFLPWLGLKAIFGYLIESLEHLLAERGIYRLAALLVGLVIAWHIYVPIHELIHAGVCFLGGGTVTTLALQPQYGGILLSRVFPFVSPESEYAGQLSGFTTPNDWVYAAVDFSPYLLSLFGLVLLVWASRGKRVWAYPMGLVLAFVPLMAIPGDYFEGVSLLMTRLVSAIDPSLPPRVLVSDDVFALVPRLIDEGHWRPWLVWPIGVGLVLAAWLAMLTLTVQTRVAMAVFGPNALDLAVSPELGGTSAATADPV